MLPYSLGFLKNKKKAQIRELKELQPLKPLKPLKFPGDLDPSKQKIVCRYCGATMSSPDAQTDSAVSSTCPNCGRENAGIIIDTYQHKPDQKGKQYNPFSTNQPQYINKITPLAYNHSKIKKDKKKGNKFRVKDEFISEEIKQCTDKEEKRINRKKTVDNILEVTKSCDDLEING